jgi:hypothetical protein
MRSKLKRGKGIHVMRGKPKGGKGTKEAKVGNHI